MNNSQNKYTSFLPVMLLFLVLRACSMAVATLGAGVWQSVTQTLDTDFTQFTAAQYIVEKVRQGDLQGALQTGKIDTCPALILSDNEYGTCTYIYYYDGYIRELFAFQDMEPLLDAGQKIARAADMKIEKSNGICSITVTDNDGKDVQVSLPAAAEVQ